MSYKIDDLSKETGAYFGVVSHILTYTARCQCRISRGILGYTNLSENKSAECVEITRGTPMDRDNVVSTCIDVHHDTLTHASDSVRVFGE